MSAVFLDDLNEPSKRSTDEPPIYQWKDANGVYHGGYKVVDIRGVAVERLMGGRTDTDSSDAHSMNRGFYFLIQDRYDRHKFTWVEDSKLTRYLGDKTPSH